MSDQPAAEAENVYNGTDVVELATTVVEVVRSGTVEDAPSDGEVLLWHPETKGTQVVPENTYEDAWAPLGWLRATTDREGNVHVLAEVITDDNESETAADEQPPAMTTRRGRNQPDSENRE